MVIKRHLKIAGSSDKNGKRDTDAPSRISYNFPMLSWSHVPNSAAELNFLVGEYVNHCHADDIPFQNAVDSFAAVRKYLPAWRDSTTIAQLFSAQFVAHSDE